MNASQENHDHTQLDDHPDRLMDTALTELVGGSAPPDLSHRILSATVQPRPAVGRGYRARSNREFWVSLAVALMLLIGATVVVLPEIRSARERSHGLAKASAKQDSMRLGGRATELRNHHDSTPISNATAAADKPKSGPSAKNGDFDSMVDLIESTVTSDSYRAGDAKQSFPSNLSLKISQSQSVSGPEASDPALAARPTAASGPSSKRSPLYTLPADGKLADDVGSLSLDARGATTGLYAYNDLRDKTVRENELGTQFSKVVKAAHELNDRAKTADGSGPDFSGDKYTRIVENPFVKAEGGDAVSTFSIDVDTASYTNVRQFLMEMNQLPPPDAVRIEELINYFSYDYAPPKAEDDAPFAAHIEVAGCPWNAEHRLARIAVKGRELDPGKRPQSNLVFLVDVSGSMNERAKLPLVVYGLQQLTKQLGENDHIAIVVYAGTEGLALPSTSGSKQKEILAALGKLQAGGSTAGGAGIQLAYQIAEDNFIKGGTNRVILCTDGDFNVGVTNTADLQRLVEKKAKDTGVFISTLGFGRGNLNDAMMVAISDHGNGNYHYIDNRTEARRVLVEQMTGTLVTIAKDVKIQVEFNPAKVSGYRLIGYEKRMLRTEDFNDDKKDAGEIGAGHTVTALYEIVPAGKKVEVSPVDGLKYQMPPVPITVGSVKKDGVTAGYTEPSPTSLELLTLKMRYKAPDGDTSKKLEWAITDDGKAFSAASADSKFAAAVAGFGLLLRDSQYKGNLTYAGVLELAQGSLGEDSHGNRKEFLEMVRKAKELRHE